jgi:AcrR family transcriptional regulator
MVWQNVEVPAKPYHHGALEAALTDAAMTVVRTSGIGELSLRDLARSVGVSPSATYRHFPSRDHLVAHVSQIAREDLARAMLHALDALPAVKDPKRRTVQRFEAIGSAYVTFAVEHPTFFEAAFFACEVRPVREDDPAAWGVLVDAIDSMANAGVIPPARRKDAPIIAWAGVHGLANILTASVWPPDATPDQEIEAVVQGITRAIS